MPSRGPRSVTVAIRTSRTRAASPATPHLFLDLDEGFCALRALAPPRRLSFQLGDLLVPRIGTLWDGPAPLRQLAALARDPPRRQVGGVQPLPAQQGTDGARRLTAARLPDDLPLVLERELPPLRLPPHLHLGLHPDHPRRAHGPP